jgi:hypothetical protein
MAAPAGHVASSAPIDASWTADPVAQPLPILRNIASAVKLMLILETARAATASPSPGYPVLPSSEWRRYPCLRLP